MDHVLPVHLAGTTMKLSTTARLVVMALIVPMGHTMTIQTGPHLDMMYIGAEMD